MTLTTLVRQYFPGQDNQGLRRKILRVIMNGESPMIIRHTVALTAQGLSALQNLTAAVFTLRAQGKA